MENGSDRLRVDAVKNKPGLAPLLNKLFTSVFNSVVHTAFVPVVSKTSLRRQTLSGVKAGTK